jgi:hypothetical protein
MEYYRGFLNSLTNASLPNLHEFEKYGNDTSLDTITDLEDLATKVRTAMTHFLWHIAPMLHISKVLGSNLIPETGYSDWVLVVFMSPSRQMTISQQNGRKN